MAKEVNLSEYVPNYYEGVKDMKELVKVENALFKDGTISLEQFIKNQFIMYCDVPTLTKFEEVYDIVAHPTDTLEWRRERVLLRINMRPPFSWWFLIRKLDDLFGKGKYKASVDFANQVLLIESGAETSGLFRESVVFINAIKPANMVYTHIPTVTERVKLKERLFKTSVDFARVGYVVVGVTALEYEGVEEEVIFSD
jgi:hypothetical protein